MHKTKRFVILLFAALGSVAGAQPFQALEKVVSQAADFSDFLARPALTMAYKEALQGYYGQSQFSCESFEEILARLKRLNDQVPGFGAELWKLEASSSFVLYRATATPLREKWELVAVPRKLHAVWNDPTHGGCVSGDCSKAEVTSPERWAVALPGSRTYLLQRQNKFDGAGLVVLPIARGKQIFSLLTQTGSASLQDSADYGSTPNDSVQRGTFYDHFLHQFGEAVSASDPVVVQYDKKDPAVAKLIRLRPSKRQKAFAGFLDEFKPAAAMAAEVARVVPRQCFTRSGVAAINLFAGFGGAAATAGSALWSPSAVKDLLTQISNPENLSSVLNVPPEQKENLGKNLSKLISSDKNAGLREKAAMALRMLSGRGIAAGSSPAPPSFSPAARAPASAQAPSDRPSRVQGDYFDAFSKALGDSSPGVRAVAASALAASGDTSPKVTRELNAALSATSPTSGGMSPGAVAATAAEGINNGKGGVSPSQLNRLMDRLGEEQNPKTRQRLMDQMARALMGKKNGDRLRDELEKRAQTDPGLVKDIIHAANESMAKNCDKKRTFDETVEKARSDSAKASSQ